MTTGIIIKVDIIGFGSLSKQMSLSESADYLFNYYEHISSNMPNGWDFIKTIGDSVLISAPENETSNMIEQFHSTLSESYNISTHYRQCSYIKRQIEIGSYKCLDAFGEDINGLFLADQKTIQVS